MIDFKENFVSYLFPFINFNHITLLYKQQNMSYGTSEKINTGQRTCPAPNEGTHKWELQPISGYIP